MRILPLTLRPIPGAHRMPRKRPSHFFSRRFLKIVLSLSFVIVAGAFSPWALRAQGEQSSRGPRNGEQVYKAACVACHGSDGRGTPQSTAGFTQPRTFPDFTRCDQT